MIIRNSYSERSEIRRCKLGALWPSLFDIIDFVRETPHIRYKMLPSCSLVRESWQNPYKNLIISFLESIKIRKINSEQSVVRIADNHLIFQKLSYTKIRKILCFTDGFMHGGAERQLVGLASLLHKEGYNVTLASYHKENFYYDLIQNCNLKYHYIDGGTNKLSKIIACYRYFKKEKYDCVISYKGGSNQIACILKALGLKYRLIVSERCFVYDFNSYQKKKFFLYRFANNIVPNSYSQEEFIAKYYPKLLHKVITITNYIDTEHFKPRKFRNKNKDFSFLVAARVSKQKNIERFLLAINKLKEQNLIFHVDWYGNVSYGESEYANKCYNLVTEYKLNDCFEFHMATINIIDAYLNCDVFCLPSLYEGFPNVICEAMSCGKPIICSNVCDNSSIICNGENGLLFNPENIDDIVEKMVAIMSMPRDTLNRMGEESRKIALSKFSQNHFVKQYITLIEK